MLRTASGWEVYFTGFAAQTPCVTKPSTILVPAITPTASKLAQITDHLFTRQFKLATDTKKSSGLSAGVKAGIAVGASGGSFLLAGLAFMIFRIKRNGAAANTPMSAQSANMEETALSAVVSPTAHELASPHSALNSPGSERNEWPMASGSPPTYDHILARPLAGKSQVPQELPGSTFILEHHPAFASSDVSSQPVTGPSSPPRSPPRGSTASPIVSPLDSPK